MAGVERKRRIKLVCPSLSHKILEITAWEEQKLDLGSISRAFGLDPNTLKLNGHLISRGVDLIASSITWKSLIRFFSARGLSTGASDSDALVVQGKLSRIGSKRSHDPVGNEILDTNEEGCITRDNKKPQLECDRLLNNRKYKVANSGSNGLDLKRKLSLEDDIGLKRSKTDEAVSGPVERKCGSSMTSRFPGSFISTNMKRMRDDEMAVAPLKRTR